MLYDLTNRNMHACFPVQRMVQLFMPCCSHVLLLVRITLCTLEKTTILPCNRCLPSLKIHTTFDWWKAPALAYSLRVLQFSPTWQSCVAGATQYTLCAAIQNPRHQGRSSSPRRRELVLPISALRPTDWLTVGCGHYLLFMLNFSMIPLKTVRLNSCVNMSHTMSCNVGQQLVMQP